MNTNDNARKFVTGAREHKRKLGIKFRKAIAWTASHTLGDTHFVLKSAADATAATEAYIVNKMTGKEYKSIIEDRHNSTEAKQAAVKAASISMNNKMKSMFKAAGSMEAEQVLNPEV